MCVCYLGWLIFWFYLFPDTSYVLANYKTEQCKRPPRLCRQGYACPQFHNSRDRRRSPKKFRYRLVIYLFMFIVFMLFRFNSSNNFFKFWFYFSFPFAHRIIFKNCHFSIKFLMSFLLLLHFEIFFPKWEKGTKLKTKVYTYRKHFSFTSANYERWIVSNVNRLHHLNCFCNFF